MLKQKNKSAHTEKTLKLQKNPENQRKIELKLAT